VAPAAEGGDTADSMAPLDGVGREGVEQDLAQFAAQDLGPRT
jgi:hypothetical protein